jgi:excisionase family DNA binding protein
LIERLLSARELAELLGFAAGTIVDWAERGDLPCFKVGGRLRFRESEVVGWVEGQRRAVVQEACTHDAALKPQGAER